MTNLESQKMHSQRTHSSKRHLKQHFAVLRHVWRLVAESQLSEVQSVLASALLCPPRLISAAASPAVSTALRAVAIAQAQILDADSAAPVAHVLRAVASVPRAVATAPASVQVFCNPMLMAGAATEFGAPAHHLTLAGIAVNCHCLHPAVAALCGRCWHE